MKRVVRRAARWAVRWLRDDPQGVAAAMALERARFPQFAYGELNARLLEILHRRGPDVRPYYTWGVLHAAHLARALGVRRISAIEFGVAGGRGLLALENAADEARTALGIDVDVYGFDTGHGLPKPQDYRDLPNLYAEGTYTIDLDVLKRRIRRAQLMLGLIADTLPAFLASRPAPVGFVSIDVDLYTSTVDVLRLFQADSRLLLPRVHCYLDDINGFTCAEFNGERLAMKEFNETNTMRKLSPIHGLRYFVPLPLMHAVWVESIYLAHILDHEEYGSDDGLVSRKEEPL